VYSQRERERVKKEGSRSEREGWNDKDNELDEREAKSIVDETVARCVLLYRRISL
jgi:hypothetical protein